MTLNTMSAEERNDFVDKVNRSDRMGNYGTVDEERKGSKH